MIVKKIIDENIRLIEPNVVVIYKIQNQYFIVYKDVFVLYGLCRFSFYKTQNLFEMEISKKYLNYILKQLKDFRISYIIVDKINQYHLIKKEVYSNNPYLFYYHKGRRLYKRRKQIIKVMNEIFINLNDTTKLKEIYYLLEGECHEIT